MGHAYTRSALCLMLGVLVVGAGGSAAAEEPHSLPCAEERKQVGEVVSKTFAALRQAHSRALPGPAGLRLRDKKVSTLIEAHVAHEHFADAVLQGAWGDASASQRARWTRTLGALLGQRVRRALRDPMRFEIGVTEVRSEAPCDRAQAFAALEERRRGRRGTLVLNLARRGNAWRVWDVSVDGASLVQTWRPRFVGIAKARGAEALDSELKRLADHLGVDWSAAPSGASP